MIKIDHEKCCLCEGCINMCDQNVLDREDDKIIVLIPDDCTGCGACADICPEGAITVSEA
jgi:NAD-dependent dihydropyrimidine dehydrogenase PreA subunit